MVVWFRYGPCTVGIEDGYIPASDFAQLVALVEAATEVEIARTRLIEQTQSEVAQMRADADQDIQSAWTEAQAAHEQAYGNGFEEGLEAAATDWVEREARGNFTAQQALQQQAHRLTQVVTSALDRMMEHEDRAGVFRRALITVSKLLKDAPVLTLRVSLSDLPAAERAVDAMLHGAQERLRIDVIADDGLVEGDCLFESDRGVVDAGLSTQLAAIKRAVKRVAQQIAVESATTAAPPSPARAALREREHEDDGSSVPLVELPSER